LQNHVLIPGCKISGAGSNRGFGHEVAFLLEPASQLS
jgi:hypothetical protein